jgi:phosphomannomutase
MLQTGKTPSQLLDYLYSKVGPHYYQRRDLGFPEGQRPAIVKRLSDNLPESIEGVKVVKADTTDGFHLTLADNSWLLIRFSGTEPVLRIYAESDSLDRVGKLLATGRKLAGV